MSTGGCRAGRPVSRRAAAFRRLEVHDADAAAGAFGDDGGQRICDFDIMRRIVAITDADKYTEIVELARAGSGIAVLAGWAFNDLPDRNGLAAVRITRGGFRRTWRAVVNGRSAATHIEPFVRSVRQVGSVLDADGWRAALAGAV